jgi:uncharacterized protein YgiB involved in biofilm formation
MPRDGQDSAPPGRRRSRTVRAAALVTLGLGAVGCDDTPPPDLPGQAEARLDACRAAHRRLGEDPARCDVLEQVVAREHDANRPRFATIAACETLFGRGACEGETLAATGPNWRPALAGWARVPDRQTQMQPVVRDRTQQLWALPEPVVPPTGGIASQAAPRAVAAAEVPAATRLPLSTSLAYYRLAPVYPDEATCTAEWQACERLDEPLPTRFATQEACRGYWSHCVEVELPDSALSMTVADAAPVPGESSGTNTRTGSSGSRVIWWGGYNNTWRNTYAGGVGPRYQGWTWTADRQPTAAYRPATGTGPLRAWDSTARRLDTANRMGTYSGRSASGVTGSTVSRTGSTISRAGFGSTGRAYSSGG